MRDATLNLCEYRSLDMLECSIVYGNARLRREGDQYIMTGRTGRHVLYRPSTDLERLNAHWKTFAERNLPCL